MYNFCTLFDSNYLTRGLALYESLEKHCPAFHLYIFAFDDRCLRVLRALNLQHATLIPLADFEDEQLLAVKPGRSRAEYCWTSTSSTILYVLEHYAPDACTYLDADLYFYSSPEPLFAELGQRSILLTEHRYSPMYNKEVKSGKYCVQFVTIKNDANGLEALRWWRERCLEWCYARYEDGKFGDQLYLDDWLDRFRGVHELQHLGGGLASWNVQQYDFYREFDNIFGIEYARGREFIAVFYHFHYLRLYANGLADLGRRKLSRKVIDYFYKPYMARLFELKRKVEKIDASFDPNGAQPYTASWKTPLLFAYRKLFGIYNIFSVNKLLAPVEEPEP